MPKPKKVYILDEETTIRRRKVAMEVDLEFVQLYRGILNFAFRIQSTWSFRYLMWLVTEMDRDNIADCSSRGMRKFIEASVDAGGKTPTLRTIRYSLKELVKEQAVVKLHRGTYKVNPSLFWANSQELREEQIKGLIEGGHELTPKVKVLSVELNGQAQKLNSEVDDNSEVIEEEKNDIESGPSTLGETPGEAII